MLSVSIAFSLTLLLLITISFKNDWSTTFELLFLIMCILLPVLQCHVSKFMVYGLVFTVSSNIIIQKCMESQYFAILHFIISFSMSKYYCEPLISALLIQKNRTETAEGFTMAVNMTFCQMFFNLIISIRLSEVNSRAFQAASDLKADLQAALVKLQNSNEQLEKYLESNEFFIMTSSHELKNTLNGLLGSLHLIMEKVTDRKIRKLLESALACGEILKNFVYNMLDYTLCETGELKLTLETHSVPNFLEKTWNIAKEMISNKRLDGYLKISKDFPSHLICDKQKLLQIILNLTSNAVKFTEKGKVYIVVQWIDSPNSNEIPFSDLLENRLQSYRTVNGEIRPEEEEVEEEEEEEDEFSEKLPEEAKTLPNLTKPVWLNEFYKLDMQAPHWTLEDIFLEKKSNPGILKLMVVDNGCGIEESAIEGVFEKTRQVPSQRDGRRKPGVGIGLWITKHLVKKMGGVIRAKSAKNVGSSFEVLIPAKAAPRLSVMLPSDELSPISEDQAMLHNQYQRISLGSPHFQSNFNNPIASEPEIFGDPFQTPKNSARNSFPTHRGKDIVLIVDDDRFNVEVLINCAKCLGKRYLVAYDGQEALELFVSNYLEISLVLSDNTMPKMSGVELAREVAKFSNLKRIKMPIFIIITGDAKDIQLDKYGERSGIIQVLKKPVEIDKIRNIISKYCA